MLVVVDDMSKYPKVEIVASTAAADTISKFKKILATHGMIRELWTDNGPPFAGQEFADYLSSKGIWHRRVTPRWPQANGEAESFMRTINKTIRIGVSENRNIETEIFSFLRDYCQTPHATTGVSPSLL